VLRVFPASQRARFASLQNARERHQRAIAANDRRWSCRSGAITPEPRPAWSRRRPNYPDEPVLRANLAFALGGLGYERTQHGRYSEALDRSTAHWRCATLRPCCGSSRRTSATGMNQPDSAAVALAEARRLSGLKPAVGKNWSACSGSWPAQAGYQSDYSGISRSNSTGPRTGRSPGRCCRNWRGFARQVGRDLGWQVRATTSVILYSGRQFTGRHPAAVMDGRGVRREVSECRWPATSKTGPRLQAVLAHEFTHCRAVRHDRQQLPGLVQRRAGAARGGPRAPRPSMCRCRSWPARSRG